MLFKKSRTEQIRSGLDNSNLPLDDCIIVNIKYVYSNNSEQFALSNKQQLLKKFIRI